MVCTLLFKPPLKRLYGFQASHGLLSVEFVLLYVEKYGARMGAYACVRMYVCVSAYEHFLLARTQAPPHSLLCSIGALLLL